MYTFNIHCTKVPKRYASNSNGEDDGNDDNDKEKLF